MNILKRFITMGASLQETGTMLLQTNELNSDASLPKEYYQMFIGKEIAPERRLQKIAEFACSFATLTTTPAVIKTLTILFSAITQNKFEQKVLQTLEELETPAFNSIEELKVQWVKELSISCKSYLLRLPSLSHVFERALQKSVQKDEAFSTLLSDLYVLINLLNLLFPFMTNAFNNIGRYYLKTNKYFHEFYKAVTEQLLVIYDYLRLIICRFISEHKNCPMENLKCFMETLPEIELLCDKMQQLTMNKYFKGRGPSTKIYFKEEEVAEIGYYIQKSGYVLKDLEEVKTAEDQLFGEYQF